ncbi:hypothetical protein POM88_047732 [Heracleum sosnowskyi]|uniref:Uncharacterized protein n=1 Tax=Heracleum sosnowskyi TaxID=360622 RepID=A0AAD8GUW3_9APIA|nr:hypothetical protein POM88_047732 [Heracleum sosnowskyi]
MLFSFKCASNLFETALKEINIADDELLKEIWTPAKGDYMLFWAWGELSHSKFSLDDPIPNYASTNYSLAKSIIKGGPDIPGNLSLGEYLHSRGLVANSWHEVSYLMKVLKEFFGVSVYPTFFG